MYTYICLTILFIPVDVVAGIAAVVREIDASVNFDICDAMPNFFNTSGPKTINCDFEIVLFGFGEFVFADDTSILITDHFL